jgi:hypothetical protein
MLPGIVVLVSKQKLKGSKFTVGRLTTVTGLSYDSIRAITLLPKNRQA